MNDKIFEVSALSLSYLGSISTRSNQDAPLTLPASRATAPVIVFASSPTPGLSEVKSCKVTLILNRNERGDVYTTYFCLVLIYCRTDRNQSGVLQTFRRSVKYLAEEAPCGEGGSDLHFRREVFISVQGCLRRK